MIKSIIDAISISLNGEFGDTYTNYTESIEQDFEEPCFFISCINPTHERFLGRRFRRNNQFCIKYFPSSANVNEECHSAAERMEICLEWIDVDGDKQMASNMHYEIIDDILHFFVNYNLFVYRKAEETEKMSDNVIINITPKG